MSRFIEIVNPATGNVLWGRSDYAKLFHALPEKVQRRAVARVPWCLDSFLL